MAQLSESDANSWCEPDECEPEEMGESYDEEEPELQNESQFLAEEISEVNESQVTLEKKVVVNVAETEYDIVRKVAKKVC